MMIQDAELSPQNLVFNITTGDIHLMSEFEFDPEKPLIELSYVVNKEQLLHLALSVLNTDTTEENYNIAESIVIWYVIRDFQAKNHNFDVQELEDKCNDLIFGALFDNLVRKGVIEELVPEDGETDIKYKIKDETLKKSILLYEENQKRKKDDK